MQDFNTQQSASILAKMFGYRGPADSASIQQFLAANPAAAARMGKYREAMSKMAAGRTPAEMNRGGIVGYQFGGGVFDGPSLTGFGNDSPSAAEMAADRAELEKSQARFKQLEEAREERGDSLNPLGGAFLSSAEEEPSQTAVDKAREGIQRADVATLQATPETDIPAVAGQVAAIAPIKAKTMRATTAAMPEVTPAVTYDAMTISPEVQAATQEVLAQIGAVSPEAQVTAEQQEGTAVSQLEAAQGTAIMMENPVKREIQDGELISGSAVDAAKVAELNAMTQAATADPSKQATVQGQLEGLMQQFEGGATPAWAAGAMRNAQATLAARGLGASSMAGQAVIQAAMESALPIAQADAATRAQFEAQNLSNRQQAAMLAAQQRAQFLQIEFDQEFQTRVQNAARVADIANMNFTAEQQIALENSRIANTVNLQNLNNRQAMVMAEAAALSNLELANLNNRQQAAVQNAQAFLQMDLTNLSNRQQTEMFKAQQNIQALFTDQAAENASRQFNASSENQTNQFFANLQTQVSQFNAAQKNAVAQFNAQQKAAAAKFNAEIQNQRDQFNAQNSLIVAQANAQWRQNIDTLNTAAQNEANREYTKTMNAMTVAELDNYWQKERDIMSFSFAASESAADRSLSLLLADKGLEAAREKMQSSEDAAKFAVLTKTALDILL